MFSVKHKKFSISTIVILLTPILFNGLSLSSLDLQQASYISQTVVYDAALYFGMEINPLRQTTRTWACDGLWNCAEKLCQFSLLPNVSWIAFRTLPRNDNETCLGITDQSTAYKLFAGDKFKSIQDLMLSSYIIQFLIVVAVFGLIMFPGTMSAIIYAFITISTAILTSVAFILWMRYAHNLSYDRGDHPPPYVVDKIFSLDVILLIIVAILPEIIFVYLWKELSINHTIEENAPINYM